MTDPTIGVWISEDGEVAAPDSRNLYRIEENNPVNSVDPSGLAEVKSIRMSFNGFNSQQRSQLVENTRAAITKLEKALSMLTEHWDELKELATFNPPMGGKPFIDERYRTLGKNIRINPGVPINEGFGNDTGRNTTARLEYIETIKVIFAQIGAGDCINYKEEKKASENESEAFIRYYFFPQGETIHITPLYWKREKARQIDIIVRELGRREGFDETNTDNPLKDASYWQETIDYLARKYDELMAKKKK